MKISSLVVAAALAIAGLPLDTPAQTVPPTAYPTKIFATVDAVSVMGPYVAVTGIVQGEQAPSSWKVNYSGSAEANGWAAMCQRSALIAMSKPGQYLLEIGVPSSLSAPVCTLTRVNP
jgi:hypothetical protein